MPELLIDEGLKLNVMPVAAGDTVAFRNTLPLKPPTEFTVIVHVPLLVPVVGWMIDTDEHAAIVKSCTLTVTIAEWDRIIGVPVIEGVVPVTVTVYVPPLPLHVSVLLPEPPGIVDGLMLQLRPVEGDMLVVRVTVPVKPFTGNTMMMADPGAPGVVLMVVGLAKIWKSTTLTFIVGVL